jgi:hypothetical protein
MVRDMEGKFIEITELEAKEIYCNGGNVFITNNRRTFWRMPCSYEYGSNAPAEQLFYRSIPKYEGQTIFYKSL